MVILHPIYLFIYFCIFFLTKFIYFCIRYTCAYPNFPFYILDLLHNVMNIYMRMMRINLNHSIRNTRQRLKITLDTHVHQIQIVFLFLTHSSPSLHPLNWRSWCSSSLWSLHIFNSASNRLINPLNWRSSIHWFHLLIQFPFLIETWNFYLNIPLLISISIGLVLS
jgi:hypothetical protein